MVTLEKSAEYTSAEELYEGEVKAVRVAGLSHFDVGKVFDCGQCFRFEPVENSAHICEYSGVAYGKFVSFAQDGDVLTIYNSDIADFENIWRAYLGLDAEYSKINEDILSRSDKPALSEAVKCGDGIRILSQEHWETVCSFIISQNNNIPRIKKIIRALCRECGDKIDTSGMKAHGASDEEYSFPSAEKVKALGVDGLFALRTGFRAKYIYDAAEKVSSGTLDFSDILCETDTRKCVETLKTVKGIGDKVACCALLFGFGRYDAFPIDVWIKKVIAKYFDEKFSPESLGPYAGIAQQYFFYYERYTGGEKI